MDEERPWVSASDLAEYAYCPRSYWYREHPPVRLPAPPNGAAQRQGVRFHQRELGAEKYRDAHVGLYVGLIVLGLLLLAGAYALYRFG